jgi:hypothetical protein
VVAQEGHAFICYVREDAQFADRLTELLRNAGIPVWRDTDNLWPGQDWRERIRDAITRGAFAFIPIFTSTSVAKGVSGQNEELYLAAEEMRRRQPGMPWIFPVRFDDCALPRLRLGGDRMLDDIQRADLFGDKADREAARLVEAVRRIIATSAPSPGAGAGRRMTTDDVVESQSGRLERELKEALRDPNGDIRLHDLVIPIADAVRDELDNVERYPVDRAVNAVAIVDQVNRYWTDLDGLLEIVILAGPWSGATHAPTWTDVVQRVARTAGRSSGNVARLAIRRFPLLALTYAGGLAALARSNYGFLKSIAIDADVRELEGRVPVVARARPWDPFSELPLAAQLIALEASGEVVDDEVIDQLATKRRGNRYTPVSDHLHDKLRPRFSRLYPDDDDYSEAFDRLEVMLGLLVADLRLQSIPAEGERWSGPYIGDPHPGRLTWRDPYADEADRVERRIQGELQREGEQWAPLKAGLFGRSTARADAAFELFTPIADRARSERW